MTSTSLVCLIKETIFTHIVSYFLKYIPSRAHTLIADSWKDLEPMGLVPEFCSCRQWLGYRL